MTHQMGFGLALVAFVMGSAVALAAATASEESAAASELGRPAPAPGAGQEPSSAPAPESVGLDQLLKLPDSFEGSPVARREGPDEQIWRRRFAESHAELKAAEGALEKAMEELEDAAGGGYSVAPPGASADPTAAPANYGRRQDLRSKRELMEQAQRDHRALVVEADLAGVPLEWREPEKPAPQPDLGE